MGNVVIFLLAVLLANVSGWAQCETNYTDGCYSYQFATCTPSGSSVSTTCTCEQQCTNGTFLNGWYVSSAERRNEGGTWKCYFKRCRTKCQADSLAGCPEGQEWDSANCQCKPKGPPTPPPEGCTYCEDYLGWAEDQGSIGSINIQVPYSRMYHCSTCYKDENGYIISAGDCTEMRNSPGTCQQNGDCPTNQICADSTGNDSPVECIASIGPNVWLRDVKTGNTFKCEADGDCARAKQLVATGECKNPYADKNKPNSSSSNENPNSSSSENPPESSGEFCDMCDKLDRIVANTQATMNNTSDISQWTLETMNKTVDIDNHLVEMGVDVSHIRTNTEATATNTGNVDNKLTTTNSLLNDIKNKNWNPTINVQAPEVNIGGDTIIINADTAKASSEILSFLKGMFGDTSNNYNANDTLGSGTEESNLRQRIDSLSSEGVPNLHDSLPRAVTGVKGALSAFKDSVNRGPYADSLRAWENTLLNNGVITGSGSNDCPAPLRRSFSWNFGAKIGTIQLGSLRFICEDALGLGFSLWSLARTILRAMVAICCMLWIYREVTGTGGGSNDED